MIIGFSAAPNNSTRRIIDGEQVFEVKHINGYLVDAPDVFIHSRQKPICDVPEIGIGSQPIDDGNYLFTEEEKAEFLVKEPKSGKLGIPLTAVSYRRLRFSGFWRMPLMIFP